MPTYEVTWTGRVKAESPARAAELAYLQLVGRPDGKQVAVRAVGRGTRMVAPLTFHLGQSTETLPEGPVTCARCGGEDVRLAELVVEARRCIGVDADGRLLLECSMPDQWDSDSCGHHMCCYDCFALWLTPANPIDFEG